MSNPRFDYPAPVAALGVLNETSGSYHAEEWNDLVTQFGLTVEHVPDLIRMAHDLEGFWRILDEEDDETTLMGAACCFSTLDVRITFALRGLSSDIDHALHLLECEHG